MRVLVAGGGVAGITASVAARRSGSSVTLVEASGSLGLNQSMFACLLSESPRGSLRLKDAQSLSSEYGVDMRLNEGILSVDSSSRTAHTAGGRIEFDSLVLATGSRYVNDEVKGMSKQGVFAMRSMEDYLALSRSRRAMSRIMVMGPPLRSLMVAQAISSGQQVKVFLGAGGLGRFSPGLERIVERAARSRGVELLNADIDNVVGMKRVEAVMSAGMVYPCDGVVMLPRSAPLLPRVDCLVGDHGGALVDRSMRTTSGGVYAAGDCAELRLGSSSIQSRLHSSSELMGEVAGVNAAGGAARAEATGTMALEVFGIEVCTAGIGVEEGTSAGLDVERADSGETGTDGMAGGTYASLVYDRSTLKVHGVQVAGPGAIALSEYVSLVVSCGSTLESLAYHESPYLPNINKDKPPIGLTAGKILRQIQERGIEAQGTHLRHR